MMYNSFIRKFLFVLDPETAHYVTLVGLRFSRYFNLLRYFSPSLVAPRDVMGLRFINSVGLAAGLDKNGDYIDVLGDLGFGFIEIGTVTRKPQAGNPKPRLFRLPEQEAIINRMGFNNKGVDYLIERLKKIKYKGVLGVNIGKNKDTPLEKAVEDYLYLYRCVAPYASYVTINVSSPNTEGLRKLQQSEMLQTLLRALKKEQAVFFNAQNKYVPLVVKIAPDVTQDELEAITLILLTEKMDGVIATNTTLSRDGVTDSIYAKEMGGLSGKPLFARSTDVVKRLSILLKGKIPIIASGGILSERDAQDKIEAGASLVQLYTGLIYQGPGLIGRCVRKIKAILD